MTEVRTDWEPEDSFVITGRGLCYSGHMPDPPFELGQLVMINGRSMMICGIERHPTPNGLDPGKPIAIQVRHERDDSGRGWAIP